jgi:nucleoside-diphosphate-sugar epimerase
MALSTVAVTGGNGKIGSAILAHLNSREYETVNIARGKRREEESDTYITADLLDMIEIYGALSKGDADAVIHMGTIPNPYNHPEFRTYESNVMSTMHILEASESLGLDAVCIASSVNAIGSEHQNRPADIQYLPVDEGHPRTPSDIYGIAKHAMEVTADGVGRREDTNLTISSLRYPWIPNEEEIREHFVEADRSLAGLESAHAATTRDVLFSYLHLDDAAVVARKAIEADFDGHETFWTVGADTTAAVPTHELSATCFPDAELRSDMEEYESLIDISKAGELLDWAPQHSWRDFE